MITRYFLYTARVGAAPLQLEAIFKHEDTLKAYIKQEEDKLACTAGMSFRCNIRKVIIEE